MKVLGGPTPPPADINRRQNTPVHWHQMRRECHNDLPPGGERELLVELGHVPVMAHAIGMKAFRNFREQHGLFRGTPRTRHARLGIDDNLVKFDRLVLDQRNERQLRACRVAAGIGDQPRLPDLAPVNFGQTVNRFLLQLRRVMFVAIPFRIGGGIRQAKVCRQVDDLWSTATSPSDP